MSSSADTFAALEASKTSNRTIAGTAFVNMAANKKILISSNTDSSGLEDVVTMYSTYKTTLQSTLATIAEQIRESNTLIGNL
jgi:hypothetical protein